MNIEKLIEFAGNHPILMGGLFFSIAIIVSAELKRRRGNGVSASEMVHLINQQDAQVVDLRDEKAFNAGHIIDSKNISLAKVNNDFASLKLKTDKPVVLVCQMGTTSGGAIKQFTEKGCEQVYNLRDGIYAWEKAKLPLET